MLSYQRGDVYDVNEWDDVYDSSWGCRSERFPEIFHEKFLFFHEIFHRQ